MTRSNLYSILCTLVRLAAVYLWADAIASLSGTLFSAHWQTEAPLLWYGVGECALQSVLALLLWSYPGPLARLAASRRSLEHFESDIAPHALQYIAFSTLGLWLAITGVAQLTYTLHRWIFLDVYFNQHMPDPRGDPKVYGSLMSEAMRTLLGAGLAIGARGLVVLLTRLRHAALPPAQPEDEPARAQEET